MNIIKRSLVLLLVCLLLLNCSAYADAEATADEATTETEETVESVDTALDPILEQEEETTDDTAEDSIPDDTDPEILLPVLSAEDAESDTATGSSNSEALDACQSLIDSLPTSEEYQTLSEDEQTNAKLLYYTCLDSLDELSYEEQALIDTTRLEDFSSVIMMTGLFGASTSYAQESWHTEYLSYAISGSFTDARGYSHYYELNQIHDHWIYDTSDGSAAYCLRPDMGSADRYYYYSSGTGTDGWYEELTTAQRDLIRLILLYGYVNCKNTNEHDHTASTCQAATQILIFEVVTKCLSTSAPYYHTSNKWSDAIPYSSSSSSLYEKYWDILGRIQNDGWLPTWMEETQDEADAAPIEMTYNETTGLYEATITNESTKPSTSQSYATILGEFTYDLPEGVTVTRDTSKKNSAMEQVITITATPEAMATGTIQIPVTTPYMVHSSSKSSYAATVYIYARQYSGSVWYQPMIQVASTQSEQVKAYMTLTGDPAVKPGSIKIVKTSDDGKISGISFTITGEDYSGTVKTGTDGTVTITDLEPGNYTVTETVPTGYVSAASSKVVTVLSDETTTVKFSNTLITGSLSITKVDKNTKAVLAGATFRVCDSNGKTVAEGETNKDGKFLVTDLAYGDYTCQEIEAPAGYVLDDTIYNVSIQTDGQVVTITHENDPAPGSITISKLDCYGNALKGASYLLEYSTDGTTWAPVFYSADCTVGGCSSPGLSSGKLTTGKTGTVTFSGLWADGSVQYRLTEVKAPSGYSLLSARVYEGTLPADGSSDISFSIRDSRITTLPATGYSNIWTVIIGISSALSLLTMGYLLTNKKQYS